MVTDREGPKYIYLGEGGRETWPCTTLSTTCPTGTALGLNAGLCSKYPVLVQQLPLVSRAFHPEFFCYFIASVPPFQAAQCRNVAAQ